MCERAGAGAPAAIVRIGVRVDLAAVAGSVLQLADGGMHAPIRHAPPWQVESAFGNEHTLPHVPQLDGSVRVFTSQPVEVSVSQLEKPALQLMISHPLWMHC